MQFEVASTSGGDMRGDMQISSANLSRPLTGRIGEPGIPSLKRPRSPRSLQAAELLLSAHDHPAQFSLSHSFSLEGEPRVLMPIAPPAAPPNPVVSSMTPAVLPANPAMATPMQPAYPPAFCVASSRTLAHTASTLPPSISAQLALKPQPPPATSALGSALGTALSSTPTSGAGAVPAQRRKARSEGPGKQGWKQEEDQMIVRMVEVSGQKWNSMGSKVTTSAVPHLGSRGSSGRARRL